METVIAAEPAWHGSPHTQMDKKTRATVVDNVTLVPDEILKMIKCSCDSDMPCKSKIYECHNANMACTACCAWQGRDGCFSQNTREHIQAEDDDEMI